MGHALIASFGGIPLIYMGDEIGLMNDHAFADDPTLADDGRWMHRPRMDWGAVAGHAKGGPAARILQGVKAILAARKATPDFAGHVPTRVMDLGHPACSSSSGWPIPASHLPVQLQRRGAADQPLGPATRPQRPLTAAGCRAQT